MPTQHGVGRGRRVAGENRGTDLDAPAAGLPLGDAAPIDPVSETSWPLRFSIPTARPLVWRRIRSMRSNFQTSGARAADSRAEPAW